MPILALVKNGETISDTENKFSSWVDIDLSEQGKLQSLVLGKKLQKAGILFDIAYTSFLKKDIHSLWLIQEGMNYMNLDTLHDWRLNGRHFGAMEGLSISSIAQGYGQKQLGNG
jgi:2,3-bisphosphoglycerate-dependent phosphoglycerate mutase